MRSFNKQLEQIQLLIDRVQHSFERNADQSETIYDKLLTMSEQLDYPYGQALAHEHLARFYQLRRDDENYAFHLEKARRIAENKNYFDVLMGYYRLEGQSNAANCNEITALSLYLTGVKIASQVKDKKSEADFYCDMGNLFFGSGAYDEAERLYLIPLELLKNISLQEAERQHKSVLVNLVHLSCAQGNLEKAKYYRSQYPPITHESGHLAVLIREGDALILLLEGKVEEARQSVACLVNELRRSGVQEQLSKNTYLILMELLLTLKDEEGAAWCMGQLDDLCQLASQNTNLRVQKLRMQYAETFGLVEDEQYRAFYETTVGGEQSRNHATAESFKSLIALYETEKERERVAKERSYLETASNTDELTQIYNRRYLGKLTSKLTQDDWVFSLGYVMIDVDYFKEYNDYYGHAKGDEALIIVAAVLRDYLPGNAYAARYGGDEFMCLFINHSQEEIVTYLKTVQAVLAEKRIEHAKSRNAHVLTLTFGICHETQPRGCNEAELIAKADHALYLAKDQGRNAYAIYKQ